MDYRRLSDDRRSQLSFLQEAILSMESPKARGRTHGVQRLGELIDDREVSRFLDENQNPDAPAVPGGLKWKDILRVVENSFTKIFGMKESAEANSTKTKIFDLMLKVISNANRSSKQPHLDRKQVFSNLKLVMTPATLEAYGPQVSGMIKQYLATPSYVKSTSGEDWAEFLIRVIKLMASKLKRDEPPSNFLYTITLDGIKHGSNHPAVISLLRTKIVDLFKFSIASSNTAMFRDRCEEIMDSFIELCRLNAVEARGILCAGGELMITHLLVSNFLDTPELQDKACELFLLQLKLHAPFDLNYGMSFCADTPSRWQEIVQKLFIFCNQAISEVANRRTQRKSQKNEQIPPKLLQLAVKCTYFHHNINQASSLNTSEVDSEEPPSKRTRVLKPFDEIMEKAISRSNGAYQLTWLTLVGAVLKKYPQMMEKLSVYEELLKIGRNLLTSGYMEYQELFGFLRSLLYCERYLLENRLLKDKNEEWNQIWDILVKSFAVREASDHSLLLLQDILLYCQPNNVGLFLQLFDSSSLQLSEASCTFLKEYLICCHLSPTVQSVQVGGANGSSRLSIIKWLIPSCKQDLPVTDSLLISIMVYGLLVKRSNYVILTECQKFPSVVNASDVENFERVLLKSSFVSEPEELVTNELITERRMQVNLIQGAGEFVDFDGIVKPALEYLKSDLMEFPEININKSTVVKALHHLLFRVKLYVNLVNLTKKYPVQNCGDFEENVTSLLRSSLRTCEKILNKFLMSETRFNRIYPALLALTSTLQSSHLCEEAKLIFAAKFPSVLVDTLIQIVRRNDGSESGDAVEDDGVQVAVGGPDSLGDDKQYSSLSKSEQKERMALEALKSICDFALFSGKRSEILATVSGIIFSSSGYSQYFFDLCYCFISRACPSFIYCDPQLVMRVMEMLQILCQRYHTNAECCSQLWQLFKDIIPTVRHFRESHKFMILVGNLSNFVHLQGIQSSLLYLDLMKTLSEFDPDVTWSYFLPKGDPQKRYPLLELHRFLDSKSPSHQVRLAAFDAISCVFKNYSKPLSIDFTTRQQNSELNHSDLSSWFTTIHRTILNMFNASTQLESAERTEENVNCVAATLYGCTRIAFSSDYMEQPGLYLLMELVFRKLIKQDLAYHSMLQANPHAKQAVEVYAHLNLALWLDNGLQPENVPVQLFDCQTQTEFYKRYSEHLVVNLFDRSQNFSALAAQLKDKPMDLLKANFVPIVCRLLCKSISEKTDLDSALDNLKKKVNGQAKFMKLLMDNIKDLIVELLSSLFEENICDNWNCGKVILPQVRRYSLTEDGFKEAFNWLHVQSPEFFGNDFTHCLRITKQCKEHRYYDVLLHLTTRVHSAHNLLIRLWRFHQLSFLVKCLSTVSETYLDFIKTPLCHFVIHAYLRLLGLEDLRDVNNTFFQAVLLNLRIFLVNVMARRGHGEVKYFYKLVIQKLVTMVEYANLEAPIAALLDVLVLNNEKEFRDELLTLDPFPDKTIFSKYKAVVQEHNDPGQDLAAKLERVLANVKNSNYVCSIQTLKYIRSLLSDNKVEFSKIARELDGKQFKDQCASELIHNLLHLVVTVVNNTEDEHIRREAGRCLGEIGPIDLSVFVLPTCGQKIKAINSDNWPKYVMELVSEYLECRDITVVSTASKVMKELINTSRCSYHHISSCDERLHTVLRPFRPLHNVKRVSPAMKINEDAVPLLKNNLPKVTSLEFSTWVTSFTCSVIDCFASENSDFVCLKPLCLLKSEFCEEILPHALYELIQLGISSSIPEIQQTLTEYFSYFFCNFINLLNSNEMQGNNGSAAKSRDYSIFTNKSALRTLLRCVQFLREQPIPKSFKRLRKATSWDSNFLLEFNYLHIAKAAQYCGAYLASIMFGEILVSEIDQTHGARNVAETTKFSAAIPTTYTIPVETRIEMEKLLLRAFTNIGEPDGVYGCGSARFVDFSSQMEHIRSTQSWDQVLSIEDFHGGRNEYGICVALKNKGLFNSLWTQLKGIEVKNGCLDEKLREIQYECGWRLSNWDINTDKVTFIQDAIEFNTAAKGSVQLFIYESLQSAVCKNFHKLNQAIQRSYEILVDELRNASLECSENLYGFLSELQMIRLTEDTSNLCSSNFYNKDKKWRDQHNIQQADFKYVESIFSLKKIIWNASYQKSGSDFLQAACDESLFNLIKGARYCGRIELAERYANELSDAANINIQKMIEIAKNYRARGSYDIAHQIIENMLNVYDETCLLYPTLLFLQGVWLYENVTERSSVVFKEYLERACDLCQTLFSPQEEPDKLAKGHTTLAKYADIQFQKIKGHIEGDLHREKNNLLKRRQAEENSLKRLAQSSGDQETKKKHILLKKQNEHDYNEIMSLKKEYNRYQLMALKNYLKGLALVGEYELFIFRVIALWFDVCPEVSSEVVQVDNTSQLNEAVRTNQIPSHMFIPVLLQLGGRLGTNDETGRLLNDIMLRCAEEHPYQTLPVLLSQAVLNKEMEITHNKATDNSQKRMETAQELVKKLQKSSTVKSSIVGDEDLIKRMEHFWTTMMRLAYYKPPQKPPAQQVVEVPPSIDLSKLKNVPVPTINIPVTPCGEFSSIEYIQSFNNEYLYVGGINAPKRLQCTSSNGKKYYILLKGNDDLRQDAVMEQVFGVMNQLLVQEPKTKKKRLQVRTYKVVPLSQRSGIIEWCENTQTLGEYLLAAHPIYRPNDDLPLECYTRMMDVKNCGDHVKKLHVFTDILARFKPVFRHFFFENFKDAGSFFERRLAYTKSVATSSIIGFVMGIGDRHQANILIDKMTAEFIHIDFGIAFDQGKYLPIPENIPFRLTRDVVDGMGFCGVEGVFRRSCENTLEVLRKNVDIFVTILEVLMYDPLYLWTLTDERMYKFQKDDSTSVFIPKSTDFKGTERNITAASELSRVRQKLAGINSGRGLSVPGHVSLLLNMAVETGALSRLFPGWKPFL